MINFLILSAVLLGAIFAVFSVTGLVMRFDQSAFQDLFRALDEVDSKRTRRVAIRFISSRYWFLFERSPRNGSATYSLCIPRTGFNAEDYKRLERTFREHSLVFEHGDEISRFFAKIPIDVSADDSEPAARAAEVARLFMEALDLDQSMKFRRGYDADM